MRALKVSELTDELLALQVRDMQKRVDYAADYGRAAHPDTVTALAEMRAEQARRATHTEPAR